MFFTCFPPSSVFLLLVVLARLIEVISDLGFEFLNPDNFSPLGL